MVRVNLAALLAVLVVCGTACIAAEQVATASSRNAGIELQVVDESGAVVPSAEVSLSSDGSKQQQTGKTDERGEFRATPAPGSYLLKVQVPGFKVFEQQIDVRAAAMSKLRAEIVVAPTINVIFVTGPTFIDKSGVELGPRFPAFELQHRPPLLLGGPQPPRPSPQTH